MSDTVADTWTVQDAKARLSELLRRARGGKPQRIGLTDACVIVSEKDWQALQSGPLGAWLVESAPRGAELALPSRRSRRGDPFAESSDRGSTRR